MEIYNLKRILKNVVGVVHSNDIELLELIAEYTNNLKFYNNQTSCLDIWFKLDNDELLCEIFWFSDNKRKTLLSKTHIILPIEFLYKIENLIMEEINIIADNAYLAYLKKDETNWKNKFKEELISYF